MSWGTSEPKQEGWYLVTLNNGCVMPLHRGEYPRGNFSWYGLACGSTVVASMKFPKAYTGGKS